MLKQSIVTDETIYLRSKNDDPWQLITMVQQARRRNGDEQSNYVIESASPRVDLSSDIKERLGNLKERRQNITETLQHIERQRRRILEVSRIN